MLDLSQHIPETITALDPIQGFVGNETFRVRTTGETYYLKSGPAVAAEAQACRQATDAGVPVPEVVAVDTDQLLLREVPGTAVDPSDVQVLTAAGQLLATLHQSPGDGYGPLAGPLHTTWSNFLLAEVNALGGLVTAGLLPEAHRTQLIDLVHTHATDLDPHHPALLHGDLHPRHIYTTNGTLTAFIDWGDALYGDPLYDLARFSIAGPTATHAVLAGYNLTLTPTLQRTFALYRAIWSAIVCRAELEANGDWFDAHLQRIAEDLTYLS
ncbi:aminoglycoside phosphotransferase family protein [Kribbella sp. NPDC051770]|uniref:aminoglycoside phosphotransferase family protein n=1 Tax=Kribbella sp. NPDC051770 TaxID=3155413 RepID=UPI00343DF8C8